MSLVQRASFRPRARRLSATLVAWASLETQVFPYRAALTAESVAQADTAVVQVAHSAIPALLVPPARLLAAAMTARAQAHASSAV